MGKCFIGFPGFDCREDLWRGVFHTNAYGGSIRFRKLLSLQDDIPDRPLLSRKLSGSVAWAQDADAFLLYSDKPSLYQQRWLSQWTCPPGCVAMFRRFIASVPTIASNTEEARFLPPARQLCTYLEKILLQLSSHSADADACMAAGIYAVTAFFLQNSPAGVPRFYGPPPQCDPVHIAEEALSAAVPTMHATEELTLNFFECIRKRFPQESNQKEPEDSGPVASASIEPAAVRKVLNHYSYHFSVIDTQNVNTKAFIIDRFLTFECGQWQWRCTLQELPYEEETIDDATRKRTFQIETDQFCTADCDGILLTALHDNEKALLHTFMIDHEKMYVSEQPTSISGIEIDKNGFIVDRALEQILSFCHIKNPLPDVSAQPVVWKRASSDFDPAYLQYLIIDAQTMKTIPMTAARNPASGAYLIQTVLPCPGYLMILEASTGARTLEADVISGFLHGAYGLRKDTQQAVKIMQDGTEKSNPLTAFEYGAFLKQENQIDQAEKHLRFAAESNIPGAQFELAELLKHRGYPDDIKQARCLLDALYAQGYRTYAEMSIDLFSDHQNAE